MKGCIFFDLGQTLINEWDFINYFDKKFLELLNGFGARIDQRNYLTLRDSVIRDRMIGHGSVKELIVQMCNLILQPGYEKIILRRIEPDITEGRKTMFRLQNDALQTINDLSADYKLGIIANQSSDVLDLLEQSGIGSYFSVKMISSEANLKKPNPEIFLRAMALAGCKPQQCVMVGDRLDTDICPANDLGMKSIRYTNSLFSLQKPTLQCEAPAHTISALAETSGVLSKIF